MTVTEYDWLLAEAKQIKTRRFFVFRYDFDSDALATIEKEFGSLPPDYVAFIRSFGDALMYRHLTGGYYRLSVLSHPKIIHETKGALLVIGSYINGGYAHFKPAKDDRVNRAVFEGDGLGVRKVADSFDEWLHKRFESCRKLYKKHEWQSIIKGPAPFTPEEVEIVRAIQLFDFEKVGVSPNGMVRIKVHNGSTRRLPVLTIGVRVPGRLEGGGYLNVANIGPGETKIIEHDCYLSIASPEYVELFRKPVPEPEDRGIYPELAGVKATAK